MIFETVDPRNGSDISYIARRWKREERPFVSIVHLAFNGTYRDGSAGSPDAHYIRGIMSIVDGAWHPSAIILDFSLLTYEWGNEMHDLLPKNNDNNAVIVSDKCRQAMSTIHPDIQTDCDITELSNYFTEFDDAVRYIAKRQIDRWNESVRRGYIDAAEILTLNDFLDV